MTPVAPMLADQAQASRSRFLSLSCRVDLLPPPSLSSSLNMAPVMESTMGTIRAIEAALEIHMERNIVTSMKPGIKEITKRAAIRNKAQVRDNKTEHVSLKKMSLWLVPIVEIILRLSL